MLIDFIHKHVDLTFSITTIGIIIVLSTWLTVHDLSRDYDRITASVATLHVDALTRQQGRDIEELIRQDNREVQKRLARLEEQYLILEEKRVTRLERDYSILEQKLNEEQ